MVIYNSRITAKVHDKDKIPTVLVRAMFSLVVICVILVAWARLTDRPLVAQFADLPVVAQREIVLSADTTGAALVTTPDGTVIADLDATEGGFIAGVWRVIERERRKWNVAPNTPVNLIRYSDGRLSLEDPTTGWKIALVGFGAGNMDAFARLLQE